MTEWQPISTAPRDGTWIILAGGEVYDESGRDAIARRQVIGQWSPRGPLGEQWQFAWFDGGYLGVYNDPTHWMPLPPPPGDAT